MTDLQDQIAQIRERLHLARKASIELYMAGVRPPQIDRMGSSADDVPRLLEAVEAVSDHAGHSLEQTANDSWDRGYDAACRKFLSLLKGHLLTGEDDG